MQYRSRELVVDEAFGQQHVSQRQHHGHVGSRHDRVPTGHRPDRRCRRAGGVMDATLDASDAKLDGGAAVFVVREPRRG